MSNAMQRIFSNMMLFALLLSVGITAFADTNDNHNQQVIPTAHYVACEIPDQANLDVDLDNHVDVNILQVAQPLAFVTPYYDFIVPSNQPFSQAYQRGPPNNLV